MSKESSFVPKGLYPFKTKLIITIALMVVTGFYLLSSIKTESFIVHFFVKLPNVFGLVGDFFPPDWSYVNQVWPKLFETLHIAIIATTIAVIISIPFSLLTANNVTTNTWIYQGMRLILNIIRTIPDIILAVVFVGLFGIGAFSGIIALIIFAVGILVKLMSEVIETIDMNQTEAIRASGGNGMQTISFAIVPQVLPQFISFSLYVFEINIRASLVLGLVGAGGIGQLLNTQINFMNYPAVSTIIIIVFAVVVVIDFISGKLREGLV
ncbi:phosphonate ABC transporter, permease protein PhnE [Gracilibacillus salitolerans]|uniref:Phosphonate ABC transporter, permease protein PhnE n=1 Tax=Gracilibacillus salitolerans TaxID=2663022 RepID=A0A5Q2TQR0_9BACI|nr:phosphonate ABC transporter, permease protein PhnE [Gracilibacillus salitolerans]QGH36531.1 phosphonate ABC transporter, permease protein PhnE [Gracilibacillus salitolerans]